MLPRNILVPTDLSDEANEALEYACELSRTFGAQLHLLNVIGIPTLGIPELGVALTGALIDSIIDENETALKRLAETKRRSAVIGQVLLRTGDARDVINQTARDLAIDLIVMSTHGRRGVSRALLGSISESIVRSAPCPVLTVRSRTTLSPGRDEVAA